MVGIRRGGGFSPGPGIRLAQFLGIAAIGAVGRHDEHEYERHGQTERRDDEFAFHITL